MEKAEPRRSAQTRALMHAQSIAICESKHVCYIYRLSEELLLDVSDVLLCEKERMDDPNNPGDVLKILRSRSQR